MSVPYSDEFETDLEDLESCTIHLAICKREGQIDLTEQRYQEVAIDHLINTYDIDADHLIDHANELYGLWKTNEYNRAERYTETVKEIFRDEVCEDYSPTF